MALHYARLISHFGFILLSTAALAQQQQNPVDVTTDPAGTAASGSTVVWNTTPWKDGVIPYVIQPSVAASVAADFVAAAREWNEAAGIVFKPRTDEKSYIEVLDNRTGCIAYGYGSPSYDFPQSYMLALVPGCPYRTLLHEMGHIIGLNHENNRPDRDDYIRVDKSTYSPGFEFDMAAAAPNKWYINHPYDLLSVMHYSHTQGALDRANPTIIPVDTSRHWEIIVGYAKRISEGDVRKVRDLYRAFNLQPAGRRASALNDAVVLSSHKNRVTTVSLSGTFATTGNAVTVLWLDSDKNYTEVPGQIVSQSASQLVFQIPAFTAETPAWISASLASDRRGTESNPVYAVFPADGKTVASGTRLDPPAADATKVLSSASYEAQGRLAREGFGSVFSASIVSPLISFAKANLSDPFPAELGGFTLEFQQGTQVSKGELVAVANGQLNFLVPKTASLGLNRLSVKKYGSEVFSSQVRIFHAAPGFFTADQNGKGWAVGQAVYPLRDAVLQYDFISSGIPGQASSIPVYLSKAETGDPVLILYASGMRGRTHVKNVHVRVGGHEVPVDYAGDQLQYEGLDQLNVRLPQFLRGIGKTQVTLTADGVDAPPVEIEIY